MAGRSSTLFPRREDLALARQYIRRYRRFKELNAQRVAAYVAQARHRGIDSLAGTD